MIKTWSQDGLNSPISAIRLAIRMRSLAQQVYLGLKMASICDIGSSSKFPIFPRILLMTTDTAVCAGWAKGLFSLARISFSRSLIRGLLLSESRKITLTDWDAHSSKSVQPRVNHVESAKARHALPSSFQSKLTNSDRARVYTLHI